MLNKVFAMLLLAFHATASLASSHKVDSIASNILNTKDLDQKINHIIDVYSPETESQPFLLIQIGNRLITSKESKTEPILLAAGYSYLGHGYRLIGNIPGALNWHLKALAQAEKLPYPSLLGLIENQCGHIYKDREENEKAKTFYYNSLKHAYEGNNKVLPIFPLMNLAAVYLNMKQLDSALSYAQRAYEVSISTEKRSGQSYIEMTLASIHSRLGNTDLASSYFRSALKLAKSYNSARYVNMASTGFAEHFVRNQQNDSAILYARTAIAAVKGTVFFYLSMKPAELLMNQMQYGKCDSLIQYTTMFKAAKDSLYNTKVNQQVQLMTFEEDMRQAEVAERKNIEKQERKNNIQYVLIALGIIGFLTVYFILSRSIILSERWISFFGILGLLVVFEFINLLIHPQLEIVTHHNPILMLIALIIIASMLIPLHHRLEHWIKVIMIERHRKARLESAKKIINDLEKTN